jgi:uncharacterized protein YegL
MGEERTEQRMYVAEDEDRQAVAPVYLVCEESALMADALGGINEGIAGLIAEIMSTPLVADVVSLGLITFSSSPRVVFRRWDAWGDPPSYDLHEGGPSRWGPAFRALATVVADELRLLRADRCRIYRPRAFFLVSGPPQDPDWYQVFRGALTYDRATGTGMRQYPIFFPVGVGAGPSDQTLRSLAYPQGKAREFRARDAAAARHAVMAGLASTISNLYDHGW